MSERMTHSFTSAPHFYLHTEVNARALTELRDQLRPVFESRHSQHLTFTDLLVLLSAKALRQHPQVLAQWSPEGLLQFTAIHIGIAVDTEEGLLVPVIRHADRLGLLEITRQRTDLVERARQGKLLPSDYEAGVFTITNLGSFRVDAFDAILNPPQAAILAVGRIKERALVENGQLTAAPAFTLSLSVDHRVLDGARAARFLGDLVDLLEMPSLAIA
jgi:pyruvate dehydrogenase E2 component (dihydrolipoamide acetyltransferase)